MGVGGVHRYTLSTTLINLPMGRSEMVGPFKHTRRRSCEGEDECVGMNQKFSKGKYKTVTRKTRSFIQCHNVEERRGEEMISGATFIYSLLF